MKRIPLALASATMVVGAFGLGAAYAAPMADNSLQTLSSPIIHTQMMNNMSTHDRIMMMHHRMDMHHRMEMRRRMMMRHHMTTHRHMGAM